MRVAFAGIVVAVLHLIAPSSAVAQTEAGSRPEIVLRAQPVPVIDVTVAGRPTRLEVIPDFPAIAILNRDASRRVAARLENASGVGRFYLVDGGGSVRVWASRDRVSFGDERGSRVMVSPNEVSDVADGVIGLAALPHRIVTFELGEERPGAADTSLLLANDAWFPRVTIGDVRSWVSFDFRRGPTLYSRTVGRELDAAGHLERVGDVVETPVILGLSALMQPVRANFTIAGAPVGMGAVRTDGGLIGARDSGADGGVTLRVEADTPDRPYRRIVLGRDALAACSSIRIDRDARTFTLRCGAPAEN